MIRIVNISHLVNQETGKTYKEENLEKTHNIPIGALVEVDFDDSFLEDPVSGLRLWVVAHERDCDGTPLYALSHVKNWTEWGPMARLQLSTGYAERTLKIIKT